MVDMAKPWKHPDTGVYYLRRQIPQAIRPAFGGKQLIKTSLGTKDAGKATVLFLQANADLELLFQAARDRLRATGSPCPSSRDKAVELVEGYFNGPEREPGGLSGAERLLLARLEVDRGLWNETATGLSHFPLSDNEAWWQLTTNAAKFRIHPGTTHRIQGRAPGSIWQLPDHEFRCPDARSRQIGRIVEQIARFHDMSVEMLPAETSSATAEYLDALPVGGAQVRKPRAASGRLRPTMRLMELFADWKDGQKPRPQTAAEYEGAALDFIDFLGDIPVAEIERGDLLDFRDEVEKLPFSMPKADRALPFTQRVHCQPPANNKKPARSLSAASVKKRIGAIQALLTYAHKQEWTKANVGRDIPITGYSRTSGVVRDTFADEQLRELLGSTLFTSHTTWSWTRKTSDCTLYWLFLLCMTTGTRIEEVGQALLADVKTRDGVLYIDVDDYVEDRADDEVSAGDDEEKSLKTRTSRRVIPVHERVAALGFEAYCDALRAAGHTRLFPDLTANNNSKHTQNASRRANDLIDLLISKDRRLVFHSLRHGFKDLAREARINEGTIDQICGHAPTTVGGRYGRGVRLAVLARELHRMKWHFIDWEALERASSATDWVKVARHHRVVAETRVERS